MPRRGTTFSNGYGKRHEAERDRWKPKVEAGRVNCWRCGQWIDPLKPWDLGHDDHDRSKYKGPECTHCNRSAGARAANAKRGHPPAVKRAW